MRTELRSGAWVEHRALDDLRGRDKEILGRITARSLPFGAEDTGLDGAARFNVMILQRDTTWALALTGWSFDLPLPRITGGRGEEDVEHRDSIGDLPLDDFEEAAAVFGPYLAKLARVPDPKGSQSATTSSSNGSSRAKAPRSPKG